MTDPREHAGEWLKQRRLSAGYATAAAFAKAIGVERYSVSTYETGKSKPSDETTERIAEALRMPVVDVRRGLGLWVPDDTVTDITERRRDERIHELRRIADELKSAVEDLGS